MTLWDTLNLRDIAAGSRVNPAIQKDGQRAAEISKRTCRRHCRLLFESPATAKRKNCRTQVAALFRLREKALNGDVRALDRLLQLATMYNNDEQPASAGLTVEDQAILAIYQERLLKGAAPSPSSPIETGRSGFDNEFCRIGVKGNVASG